MGISLMGISQTWEKQHMGNFLMETGEVQTFQMNQLHNNDVMNVNGQWIDGLNE